MLATFEEPVTPTNTDNMHIGFTVASLMYVIPKFFWHQYQTSFRHKHWLSFLIH